MASITTNTSKSSAIQILRQIIAKQWTLLKPAHPKEAAHRKDPRIAQDLRARARADVDHLLRQFY